MRTCFSLSVLALGVATLLAAGCRRLALASSGAGTHSISERERGFREAAQAAGVTQRSPRSAMIPKGCGKSGTASHDP